MWPGNLSPDDSDFRTANFLRGPIDESYLLSYIPAGTRQYSIPDTPRSADIEEQPLRGGVWGSSGKNLPQ